jgi:protein phosphatase
MKNTPAAITFSQECHPGLQREENQDSVAHAATPRGELFVVSDGVGGYHGGAEASAIVTSSFPRHLRALPLSMTNEAALAEAGRRVNAEVFAAGQSGDASRRRMSATVVLALISKEGASTQAIVANAGDSRAYLIRSGQMTKVSTDHTAVQAMVDAGVLTPEQAKDHPHASVLTRTMGQAPEVELDLRRIPLEPDDQLLLCSDGLHGFARPGEMLAVVTSPQLSLPAKTRALLDLALAAGGPDNISVQLIQVAGPQLAAPAGVPPEARTMGKIPLAVATGALILLGSLAGVHFYQVQQAKPVAIVSGTPAPSAAPSVPPVTQSGTHTNAAPPPPEHAPKKQSVVAELMTSADPARGQFVHFRERWKFIGIVDQQHQATCEGVTGDRPVAYIRDNAVLNQAPANDPEIQSYFPVFLPYTAQVEAACGRFDLLLLPARHHDPEDRVRQAASTLKHDAQALKHRAGAAIEKPQP